MKYATQTKHGACRRGQETPEYLIWAGIRKRIYHTNCRIYPYYGGKGVRLCERWQDFSNFLADMGPRPSSQHSIDRFPNQKGHYEPGNCRWATRTEQMRNKSDNRMLTLHDETHCVAEWAERLGISVNTIRKRVYSGYTDEQALNTQHFSRRWRA